MKPSWKGEEKLFVGNSFPCTWLPLCSLGFIAASRIFRKCVSALEVGQSHGNAYLSRVVPPPQTRMSAKAVPLSRGIL